MFSSEFLRSRFHGGLAYEEYVAGGQPHERENWRAFDERVRLTEAQRALIAGFVRRVNVLCVSGTWCGDCVQQCPFLAHVERANPGVISLRFVDRDMHMDLSRPLSICGGHRVPVVLFLDEDFEFLALAGDRTLARYRAMAAKRLGGACPLPGAPTPPDEAAAELTDWVDEFERVELMLRLSPRMRQRYGD